MFTTSRISKLLTTATAASLLVGALALAPEAAASWNQGFEMTILVDGVERPEYTANGAFYIEALRGRDYQIRLRNPLGVRVGVALAVDGLNTIDAKHTDARSARKWILEPYETITLAGWQVSSSTARAFTFTSEEKSYGAALGQTQNLGAIEAVFFRERARRPVYQPYDERPYSSRDQKREGEAKKDRSAANEPAPAAPGAAGKAFESQQSQPSSGLTLADDYAATGMGRRERHDVTQINIELESAPAATLRVRYEYRNQLVRLGVLPPADVEVPRLSRRERSRGFEPFCPEPRVR